MSSLGRIDNRIIYISVLIVVALALLSHWTAGQMYSLAVILLITFVVLGNIGYLYSQRGK